MAKLPKTPKGLDARIRREEAKLRKKKAIEARKKEILAKKKKLEQLRNQNRR